MAVRRLITLCFFVCSCANIIYTQDLADRYSESTTLQSEEFSNRTESETGNLTGIITAHKDGARLELKISGKVTWRKGKSLDSETCAATVEQKGEKGGKGADGTQGATGEKGVKGDKGAGGIQGTTGEKGEKGDKGADGIKGATGEKGEKGHKGDIGLQGVEGIMGEKGENGIDGTNGGKGEPGKCIGSYGENKPDNYGSKEYPAYSCYDSLGKSDFYVNRAEGFQVLCLGTKTCILNLPKSSDFNVLIKNDKVWLSSGILDITMFYNLKIPQLSYLMTTNEGFELTLEYSSEVEILEILSWNGITMKTTFEPLSNGCKGIKKTEGTQTRLEVKCKPANYLPMDFNIKTSIENFSIKLLSLCFF